MGETKPRPKALGGLDRWLLAILCGTAATALVDRAIASFGTFSPDEWLAIALAPATIGWAIAGTALTSARSAAAVATLLYGVAAYGLSQRETGQGVIRAELVGLLVVSVFSAHAGRSARRRSESDGAARAFIEALGAGKPLPPAITRERLQSIGVTSAVLTEAGLLGALLAQQRGRERRGWLAGLGFAAAFWVAGLAMEVEPALWIGAVCLAAWLSALAARVSGIGTGRSPFDWLAAGHFERATTEFLKILATVPADTLSRIGLAIGQYHLGRYDDAAQELLRARQFGFRDLPLGVWLGVERELALALRGSGAGQQAVAAFERLHLIFPNHAETLYEMGSTLRALGEKRAAAQVLDRAQRAGSREARELLEKEDAGAGQGG